MECRYPDCSNPAAVPGVPLCDAHMPQMVEGILFPPDQFFVVSQVPIPPDLIISSGFGAEDPAAGQPAGSQEESDLFGGGHDRPPWEDAPPWEGNGGASHA